MGCSARTRLAGRRSFHGATRLSMQERRRRGPGRRRRLGRWDRRVRVLRCGQRCCAGCSPWTSFSARAAAAGGGSWACTRGVSACVSCWSGSGSTARRHPRRRRARRRERRSNRTRPSRSASLGPTAPALSPASAPTCVRALAAPGFSSTRAGLPTARHRSERRRGASLSSGLDSGSGGRDLGSGQGEGGEVGGCERTFGIPTLTHVSGG